ncbi:RHS repeat-associated core domain-containing protein, partial [Pseudomonas syringae]|uniref:RHS repeat-associated core domain-containing protein n=1 Tax=Pseudomonas syringae TaxID=317 RepID=UPI001F18B4EB
QHRLVEVKKTNGQTASYRYDPFGRRISKTVDGITTEFFWQGDKLIAEHHKDKHRSFIYEPDSFRPMVMLEGFGPKETKPYHYQLDHLGTPQELTTPEGEIVWSAHYRAYGEISRLDIGKVDNSIRFQGQYFDEESGLHYNRHRYYNPDIGRYLTPDPVKLAGGINGYQYAPNPMVWVDPLGLNKCPGSNGCKPKHRAEDPEESAKVNEGDVEPPKGSDTKLSRNGAFRRAKAIGGIPTTQHPNAISREAITDQGRYTPGRVYTFKLKHKIIEIREHSLGHEKGNHGPHFNTEVTINRLKVPLAIGDDTHTYYRK